MAFRATDLLHAAPGGLYCPPGDFYIDPTRRVNRAVITHGHADHARAGHGSVLATPETLAVMAVRLGARFARSRQHAPYGEPIRIGDVSVTLHPAGHVLGSAQIAIEWRGFKAVISGDYKRRSDPTTVCFEVVPCNLFVTEATFGLPIYRHPPPDREIGKLVYSLGLFAERPHLLGAYSLGKAQRLIGELRKAGYDRPIFLHNTVERLCRLYQEFGVDLGDLRPVQSIDPGQMTGGVVICPPAAMKDRWAAQFNDPLSCAASGWMQLKTHRLGSGSHLPMVLSDHADWPALCATITDTGAGEIWITHGSATALSRWCALQGLDSLPPPAQVSDQANLPGLDL